MTTSSLCGKPDDYESRKQWTNKDWFTHVGAWENEKGQLCFGSSMAFCAMLGQFHKTHTQHIPELILQLEELIRTLEWADEHDRCTQEIYDARVSISRAKGERP